jgi:hypothetical protein
MASEFRVYSAEFHVLYSGFEPVMFKGNGYRVQGMQG